MACQGQSTMHQPVPAERYFANNSALPVAQACQYDDAAGVVKALQATHVSPNTEGEQGMSLLLLAMSNRSNKAVEALLTHGADPNLETRLGLDQTPNQPVAGAAGGDNPELLRILLDHGGDPNSKFDGSPALFEAAERERYDQLQMLLDHGANINIVDKDGTTAVTYLAGVRNFKPVAFLIERGADIHVVDKFGSTVAFELQSEGFGFTPEVLNYQDMLKVKHLLEAKGIHFPVVSPYTARDVQERAENVQRRQWEATAEGRHWLEPIRKAQRLRELNQDPGANYARSQHLRLGAELAFQAWRKTQPGWVPSVNFFAYYEDAPTLAQESLDMQALQARFQADSLRWVEQTRALP